MARYCLTSSHFLNQCWPLSVLPYDYEFSILLISSYHSLVSLQGRQSVTQYIIQQELQMYNIDYHFYSQKTPCLGSSNELFFVSILQKLTFVKVLHYITVSLWQTFINFEFIDWRLYIISMGMCLFNQLSCLLSVHCWCSHIWQTVDNGSLNSVLCWLWLFGMCVPRPNGDNRPGE